MLQAVPATPIAERAVQMLRVPGYADFLVADGEDVWATNEGRVERFRFGQPGPVASVAVPEPCGAMAIALESLWVANCSDASLYRIDPIRNEVTAVLKTGLAEPKGELSIAAGAGSIWLLTDFRGVLSRIDPATNGVVATVSVKPSSYAAVFGFDAVWVTNTEAGSVQRIDPATNRVVATIETGPRPLFLAAGEGGVFTLNQGDGTVTRIDPATNAVAATIDAGVPGTGGDIATGLGRVWVRAKEVLLSAIDPQANTVVERFGPKLGSGAVRVAGPHVWVTDHDSNAVWVLPAPK
jgi:YVTN family beta-propeller protein